MPILDTEYLMALRPSDKKHSLVLKLLKNKKAREKALVPDVAFLEFHDVLRAYGKSLEDTGVAILSLHQILIQNGIREVKTITSSTILKGIKFEKEKNLSYYDAFLAASAESIDGKIISDDEVYDNIPTIERIKIEEFIKTS